MQYFIIAVRPIDGKPIVAEVIEDILKVDKQFDPNAQAIDCKFLLGMPMSQAITTVDYDVAWEDHLVRLQNGNE